MKKSWPVFASVILIAIVALGVASLSSCAKKNH